MKVYHLNKIPKGFKSSYKSAPLSKYELLPIEKNGADVALYWYGAGDYEGIGQIIFRINNKWYLHDMGHCSCYGPTDELEYDLKEGCESLDDLLSHCSKSYRKQIKPLIDLAKKKGYE